MPISTRQTSTSGEGQDSRSDEQPLVEALPAVVQTAIADIEDKFSSRLNQRSDTPTSTTSSPVFGVSYGIFENAAPPSLPSRGQSRGRADAKDVGAAK